MTTTTTKEVNGTDLFLYQQRAALFAAVRLRSAPPNQKTNTPQSNYIIDRRLFFPILSLGPRN